MIANQRQWKSVKQILTNSILTFYSLEPCCTELIEGMKITVRQEIETRDHTLHYEANKKDYVTTVTSRIDQVKITGGDNEHPLQLVEVRVMGGE